MKASICALGLTLVLALFENPSDARSTSVCSLAPETGLCRAAFVKYFYNPKSGKCETFIWGGCGGNDNRFDTAEECQTGCAPTD